MLWKTETSSIEDKIIGKIIKFECGQINLWIKKTMMVVWQWWMHADRTRIKWHTSHKTYKSINISKYEIEILNSFHRIKTLQQQKTYVVCFGL